MRQTLLKLHTLLQLDAEKWKHFWVFNNGNIGNNRWWKTVVILFSPKSVTSSVQSFLYVWASVHEGWRLNGQSAFRAQRGKQQPELLFVWKPRLPSSVSSAIVLVIVNLGHLPAGISHSSNKFHKANHKVLYCWLPLIELWAQKQISKYLGALEKLTNE